MIRRPAIAILSACAALLPATAAAQTARPAAAPFEVTEASIETLQKAMTDGRITSLQLVDAYLARIRAYDHAGPALNTMIRLSPKARSDAAALDAERKAGKVRGPLHGVPIVVKDNYDTKDMITTAGSLALATHRPKTDAFVIQKLRDAGAVIVGKTNLHELASGITSISSLGGQTLNPYDPARCPGGSSGGTGAAVAASFAAIGWGTDTCGSIRIPSAFASLFGLRPTEGLFSRDGIVPLSLTQDVPGPLARTVTDLAIALDATVGPDQNDPATAVLNGKALPRFRDSLRTDALRGARIGIFAPYFRDAEPDVADTVRAAIMAMKALGADVVNVPMPDFDQVIAGSRAILMETRFDLADYLKRPGGAPVGSLTEILDKGLFDRQLETRHRSADTAQSRTSPGHEEMLRRQAQLRARMVQLMDSLQLDAIAYPTIAQRPTMVGVLQTASSCALAAQAGLPAISMPAGFTFDGLPTGLELMGRPFADARLVAFAYAFEKAGARRRPPPTTPPLVAGRAPMPRIFTLSAGPAASSVSVAFTFDATRGELKYSAHSMGTNATDLQAVVIRRWDKSPESKSSPRRVIHRMLGPDMISGAGVVRLFGDDLEAFKAGRLTLAVFGSTGIEPLAEVVIQVN
jgi:Asp-tRNA(Asn)/Glu-tRNA(Gln) amidotransferase A subunit family amidase